MDKEHSKHAMHIKGKKQKRDGVNLNNSHNGQHAYIRKEG